MVRGVYFTFNKIYGGASCEGLGAGKFHGD